MQITDEALTEGAHPIDIVQAIATHHHWDFDRPASDQIAMVLQGLWRGYALTLAWSPEDRVLRLICSFDFAPPADRLPAVLEVVNLANDRVWEGGFTFWADQGQMVWRYGLVLAGDAVAHPDQVDRIIAAALTACERFYPSFQLVSRGGRGPAAALDIAFGPTYGRA